MRRLTDQRRLMLCQAAAGFGSVLAFAVAALEYSTWIV